MRRLRLTALATNPEAFGSTYVRDATQPSQFWEQGAVESERGTEQRTFVLAGNEDRWLGMAFTKLSAGPSPTALLGGMWISPPARGRGGSALLCEACIDWASRRGAEELTLTVVVGNDAARRAYETAGFAVRERRLSSYDGRTLDEFAMSRGL